MARSLRAAAQSRKRQDVTIIVLGLMLALAFMLSLYLNLFGESQSHALLPHSSSQRWNSDLLNLDWTRFTPEQQIALMEQLATLRNKLLQDETQRLSSPRFIESSNNEPWKEINPAESSWKDKQIWLRQELKRLEKEMNEKRQKGGDDDDEGADSILKLESHEQKMENKEDIQAELPRLDIKEVIGNYTGKIPKNCRGKASLLKLFLLAQQRIPDDLCDKLPAISDVKDIYGLRPVFVKDCGTVVGHKNSTVLLEPQISSLPNGGVGLLKRLIASNIPGLSELVQHGTNMQNIAMARAEAVNRHDLETLRPAPEDSEYLRIVVVKDPYFWMQSICYSRSVPEFFDYAPLTSKRIAGLDGGGEVTAHDQCPYLVTTLNAENRHFVSMPLRVRSYGLDSEKTDTFDSLPAYWNQWISSFVLDKEPADTEASAPYIVIRYEDILFHPEQVVQEISQCSGHETKSTFEFKTDLAARELRRFERNPTSGLLDRSVQLAMPLYTNETRRIEGLSELDLEFLEKSLDFRLLKMFRYELAWG